MLREEERHDERLVETRRIEMKQQVESRKLDIHEQVENRCLDIRQQELMLKTKDG